MLQEGHATQEAIDAEIAVHEEVIRELRTRRNTLAPISKTPPELLADIFILAKLLATAPQDSEEWQHRDIDGTRGWLNVACVCRCWRNVALNAPRMWNRLDVSKIRALDWAAEILARSQHAPLHVKCTDSASDRAILSAVMAHMDRIEDLEINSVATHTSTGLLRIMEMIATNNAPSSLRFLHLHKLASLYSATDPVHEGIHRVFSEIQMPYLQTLDVGNLTLPPIIPVLSQLRQFTYAPPHQANSSLITMLSILRSMPSLEHLEIGSTLQTPDTAPIEESSNVELTKLSYLSYNTVQFMGSSLFRHIQYPPSARVKFTSQSSRDHARATLCIGDLRAILSHMASSEGAAHIDAVTIQDFDGARFHMRVSDQDVRVLELHLPMTTQDIFPLFRLSVMLPRSQAQTFRISGFSSIKEGDWASLFRRHEHVQKLEVEEVNSTCIQALLKPSDAEQPPFPRLKTLQLGKCDVKLSVTSIVRVLEERRLLGTAIDFLRIIECRVTKDIISQLEKHVKVEWDGGEKFDEDYEFYEFDYDDDEDDEDDENDDSDNYSVTLSDLMVG